MKTRPKPPGSAKATQGKAAAQVAPARKAAAVKAGGAAPKPPAPPALTDAELQNCAMGLNALMQRGGLGDPNDPLGAAKASASLLGTLNKITAYLGAAEAQRQAAGAGEPPGG